MGTGSSSTRRRQNDDFDFGVGPMYTPGQMQNILMANGMGHGGVRAAERRTPPRRLT